MKTIGSQLNAQIEKIFESSPIDTHRDDKNLAFEMIKNTLKSNKNFCKTYGKYIEAEEVIFGSGGYNIVMYGDEMNLSINITNYQLLHQEVLTDVLIALT
jgi:hypothetical protein